MDDKELLHIDLCGRLPYNTKIHIISGSTEIDDILTTSTLKNLDNWQVKPYLRPISSLKDDELKYFGECVDKLFKVPFLPNIYELLDFFNRKHIDYRGLIEKDLAISVSREFYEQ